jgi:hypothetical protein
MASFLPQAHHCLYLCIFQNLTYLNILTSHVIYFRACMTLIIEWAGKEASMGNGCMFCNSPVKMTMFFKHTHTKTCIQRQQQQQTTLWPLVRKRTIQTE